MKIPFSQNAFACGLLREELEKLAEFDIRSAHGENVERPEIGTVSREIYEETIRWMESSSDFDSFV
jgi:hypothetical protein